MFIRTLLNRRHSWSFNHIETQSRKPEGCSLFRFSLRTNRNAIWPAFIIVLTLLANSCARADKLAKKSDEELNNLAEEIIMQEINIYHGFNRCSSNSVQRLKKEIIRRHPDWDDKARQAILNCEIYLGMNLKQVATAWGLPELKPTQNKNIWTSFESWNYSTERKNINLSFENNKLANIQYLIK
ncbi:MAG: hypothetical protein HZA78_09840 [Candidatus Schekmanbacteria bacterium]|nr:hypothetical protein [Candidatus Schekmanbacteria bacterium]